MYDNKKEVIIEDFVIESMQSMRFNISCLKYPLCKDTILFYTSCINNCILELLNENTLKTVVEMNNFLYSLLFLQLSSFEIKTINGANNNKLISDHLTFLIWCVDSFFYFFKYSNSPYNVLTKYSTFIEKVVNDRSTSSNIFEMSNDFANLIERD